LRQYSEGRRDFSGIELVPERTRALENVRLDGIDFSGAFLDASFAGSSLRKARFDGANVKTCIFDRTDLSEATFAGAALDGASFARAGVWRADFLGATWQSHVFRRGEVPPDAASNTGSRHERFSQALGSSNATAELHRLACQLRDEGESRQDVAGLFELFRCEHADDANEEALNAILDVLDHVVGWCQPNDDIFS
jgi:hypothetical protein